MTDEIKLQKCSTCKCTQVQEQYFSVNRKGRYNKTCDTCREKGKAYREANKDKKKQYDKQYKKQYMYYMDNQDKIKQQVRQYYETNKDKIREYKKQYSKQYREDKHHHCKHNTPKLQCKICDPQGHLRHVVSSHKNYNKLNICRCKYCIATCSTSYMYMYCS